jgi:hypothetical protein
MPCDCQRAPPPVGSWDVSTEPEPSTVRQSDFDGHATALRDPFGSISAGCHEDARVGFVEVMTSPPAVAATHSDRDGQDTPSKELLLNSLVRRHRLDPPVGSVEVKMSSTKPSPVLWSTPTHSNSVGHESPDRTPGLSPFDGSPTSLQALRPAVGSVETRRFSSRSPATQKCADRQDTIVSGLSVSMRARSQLRRPRVGWLEVRTFPFESTAAQNEAVGQEIAAMWRSTRQSFHVCVPAVGRVEVKTSPALSRATHSGLGAHVMSTSGLATV